VQGNIIFDANFEEEEDAVSGTMNPIFYQYESECLIPDNKYKVAGYTFAGWSMKRDGSGKRYHTGDDLKNVFDTEGDHTLYGVWKTATDTPFRIRVCKTNVAGDKEIEEVLHLQGETNCSVRQALFDFYEMDSLEKVFHGFKVVDSNALNTTIRRDGSTEVTIHLQRKTYRVIVMSETEKPYYEKECIYEEEITLPTELEGVGNVARYSSENGMNYSGDLPFSVMDDMTLVPQHSVCYWLDGQIEEQFVTHGKETEAFTPEEKGYCFDGWYTSKELDARFCDAGERISVSENMTLYGKWTTNKKSYTITYDFGDYDDVIALEELTPCYTYGGTVLLPTAVQLDIPDRYEFVGWYEKGDETHKIIRRIIGSMYGDKTFCLYLRERTVLPTPTLPSASEIPSPSVEPMDPSTTDDPSSSDTPLDPSVSAAPMPSNVPNNSASNLPQTPNKTIIQNPLQGSDKKLGKAQNDTFTVRKITYRVLSVKKKTVTVTGADKSISVLRIPASVTKNRVKYRVVKVSSKAFYKHNNLRKVIIGKHVTAIGNKAFAYNRKLKFASLGRSVTKIGTKSFYGNKKLKKLVISGKKLRTVGTKAFSSGQSGKIIVKAVKGKQKKYCRLLRKAGMKSKIRVS
ncbi:MAG: InlB B-repeat-containing protein, partial [Clostridium sp.]